MSNKGIIWFRNDLRTLDHASLATATAKNDAVIAVYCFDPRNFEEKRFGFEKTGVFRTKFLIETITNLKQNLKNLHIPLFVLYGKPEVHIPQLVEKYKITDIYVQKEWTPEEQSVSEKVAGNLNQLAVTWHWEYDQFLFHPEDVPFEILNVPQVFTQFRKKCEKYASVRTVLENKPLNPSNYFETGTEVPKLDEFGHPILEADTRSAYPFEGGQTAALQHIDRYFWQDQLLATYKETRNGLIGTDFSSKFSGWLAHGCISPRQLYQEIKRFEERITSNNSTYWLFFELIWRDYFKYISLKHGNAIFQLSGILNKSYDWSTDQEKIDRWINGETKYDFVNANMLEIKKTGWMSNRGRQNVASFFAKELQLDWRIGAAYFESLLIDYDVHSNYGNWMYVAGVGNDPRDRKFNIESQAHRYDPDKQYRRLWLQENLQTN